MNNKMKEVGVSERKEATGMGLYILSPFEEKKMNKNTELECNKW